MLVPLSLFCCLKAAAHAAAWSLDGPMMTASIWAAVSDWKMLPLSKSPLPENWPSLGLGSVPWMLRTMRLFVHASICGCGAPHSSTARAAAAYSVTLRGPYCQLPQSPPTMTPYGPVADVLPDRP